MVSVVRSYTQEQLIFIEYMKNIRTYLAGWANFLKKLGPCLKVASPISAYVKAGALIL